MLKRINIPAVIGFNTFEAAEDFLSCAEVIIPKLKMENLEDFDEEAQQHLFMFYTRKDKTYREAREAYKDAVPAEENVNEEVDVELETSGNA